MANQIQRPNRLYTDLDLSFAAHPVTGDVVRKVDINSVKQALKLLLFTNYKERKFQPQLGSPLYQLLFQPMSPVTTEVIRQSIERVIMNFEPRILLQGVDVVAREDIGEYEITVFFTVIGIPTPVTFSTNLKRLR